MPFFNNPGQKRYGGSSLSTALQKAAQEALYGAGRTDQAADAQRSAAPVAHSVKVEIGGRSYDIDTANQQSSDALIDMLRGLERASRSVA